MDARPETRFEGTLTTWNESRGFGFITPTERAPQVFVHIKAFEWGSVWPHVGLKLTYELGANAEGKARAERVQSVEVVVDPKAKRKIAPPPPGSSSYLAIPAFIVLYIIRSLFWGVPHWVIALYLAMSILCFVGYWIDKSAAVHGRWRVPEATLLIPGLLGGWPGAIVAQQVFRHKTRKTAFRVQFWTSVGLNVILFVLLTSRPVMKVFSDTFEFWLQHTS